MSEYRSRAQYKQQRALNVSGDVRSLICFCVDTSGSMTEHLTLFGKDEKIDLLTKVLKNIVVGFRSDPKMRHSVAISIVTYNKFAQLKEPFQDAVLYEDLRETCEFREVSGSTNMTNGLNTSLSAIHSAQQEMTEKDQSTYTPKLVFMTDGEPVGDDYWKRKFEDIRRLVSSDRLQVFPVGIGDKANMKLISGLLPDEKRAFDFEQRYCMRKEDDFVRVFDEIKAIVYNELGLLPDEMHSRIAYEDDDTKDTQSGYTDPSYILNFIS